MYTTDVIWNFVVCVLKMQPMVPFCPLKLLMVTFHLGRFDELDYVKWSAIDARYDWIVLDYKY